MAVGKENKRLQEENSRNGEILWQLTWDLIKESQWDRALLVGKHLASISPDVPAAHVALGMAWMGVNDLDSAEKCFRKALELDGEEVHNFLLIAHVCACRGDFEGQLDWAVKASKINPKETDAHFEVAYANLRLGRLNDAAKALLRILKLSPDNVRACRMLAKIYLDQQKLGDARDQFWAAVKLTPEDPSLWSDLGHTMSRMTDHENALGAFRKALELEPDNPTRLYHVGDAHLAMNRLEEAVSYFVKAVQLDPDYTMAHYDLGLALGKLKKYKESAEASKAALRNDPEMKWARTNLGFSVTNNLGLAYMNQSMFKEAESCFRRNLKLMAPACFNLGLTLRKQKRFQDALPYFQQAVQLEPADAEYLDLLGDTLSNLDRLEEARDVLQKAIAVDAGYKHAQYDLGVVLAKMRTEDDRALEQFKRVVALDKDYAHAYYGIACIFALKGRKKSALKNLEESLKKGFRDKAHIEKDSDWDNLRGDEDFKRILTKYPEPAKEEY